MLYFSFVKLYFSQFFNYSQLNYYNSLYSIQHFTSETSKLLVQPCVSSGTHPRREKRLKKSMCDLERAHPKRCVSIRSRKKVAVEFKKTKKICDFRRMLSSFPTSKMLVPPCVSSGTHPKRGKRFVKNAMWDLERERPKRCVEKCGSRVQKNEKNYVIFDVLRVPEMKY